jgi:hypothetical protein
MQILEGQFKNFTLLPVFRCTLNSGFMELCYSAFHYERNRVANHQQGQKQ